MSLRTSGTEVKAIFDTSITAEDLETGFIADANAFVTAHLSGAGLSDDLLARIEKYVAAHFASAYDQRISQGQAGMTINTYQGKWGSGLQGTDYGQRAIDLDTSGTLRQLANEKGIDFQFSASGV